MAAVLQRFSQRNDERRTFGNPAARFGAPGGPDPSEAGRRGNKQAQLNRKWREVLEAEEKVLGRNNGMAHAKVWEDRKRRLRELERARTEADRIVRELRNEADLLHDRIDELRDEFTRLRVARR